VSPRPDPGTNLNIQAGLFTQFSTGRVFEALVWFKASARSEPEPVTVGCMLGMQQEQLSSETHKQDASNGPNPFRNTIVHRPLLRVGPTPPLQPRRPMIAGADGCKRVRPPLTTKSQDGLRELRSPASVRRSAPFLQLVRIALGRELGSLCPPTQPVPPTEARIRWTECRPTTSCLRTSHMVRSSYKARRDEFALGPNVESRQQPSLFRHGPLDPDPY
jgi:hypothetical protein